MTDPNVDPLLERRLRRDADAVREAPSAERRARILAALEVQERAPAARSYRGLLAVAALLLILAGLRFSATGATDFEKRAVDGGTASATGHGGDAVQVARNEASVSSDRASRTFSVRERVSGWAASSSMALRENVDDPLRRELRALSLDLGRVLDTVLVDLPSTFSRLIGQVISK